jgi:hypothetical protein
LGVFTGAIGAVALSTMPMQSNAPGRRLLPDRVVRQRLGNIAASTLFRWDRRPELGFPKPVIINNRKYRDEQEFDEFLRSRVTASDDASRPATLNEVTP